MAPIQKRRKVLQLTQFLNIGGLERLIFSLCIGLKETDWSPTVVFYDEMEGILSLAEEFRDHGISVELIRKSEGFSPKLVGQIQTRIRHEQIDLVHSHDLGPLIYGSLQKILKPSLKLIHTQHTLLHRDQYRRYRVYESIFSKWTNQWVVVSDEIQAAYRPFISSSTQIQNGILFQSEPPRLSVSAMKAALVPGLEDKIWVTSLARLDPGKGQNHVLELWKRLPLEALMRAELIFVGPVKDLEFLKGLKEQIAAMPSTWRERIHFQPETLTPQNYFQASEIYISGSEFEGMPLAPIEAVGEGALAFLSDIPGHAYLDGLCESFSLSRLEEAAQKLAECILSAHTEKTQLLRRNRAEIARGRFGIDKMVRDYVSLYESLCGER